MPYRSIVPVYQTLSPLDLLGPGRRRWKEWFPFNAEHGMWTFCGRVALHVGLQAMRLPAGSAILVPNYFQGVEIDTLVAGGFELRFYRVDQNLRVDLDHVRELLDGNVSALYVIHYFGFSQEMEPISDFVRQYGLKLIEDCALSLFSRDAQQWLGQYGDMALFSVYKTCALPHGGYLVTRDALPSVSLRGAPFRSTLSQTSDLFQQHLRAQGWVRAEQAIRAGYATAMRWRTRDGGARIASGSASWDARVLDYGSSRAVPYFMRYNDPARIIETRRRNYKLLSRLLEAEPWCLFPDLPAYACPLFFPARVKDKAAVSNRLMEAGIGCVDLWRDPHPACPPQMAREVEHLRQGILELPVHQSLSETDVERVARGFLAAVRGSSL